LKLLLDTHALLWALAEDDRVAGRTLDLIIDPANQVLVSIVSLWEIAIKVRAGKLGADVAEVASAAQDARMTILGVSLPHLRALRTLPAPHRDPFDHLLIAQAMTEDAIFVSDDRHVVDYPVRHLACASRE
jgi:PIN domain nuclease of toxin-antitoxin system